MKNKKAVIIFSFDNYANSVKPKELKCFLEKNNYDVELFSTAFLSRIDSKRFKNLVPKFTYSSLQLYILELIFWYANKQKNLRIRKILISLFLQEILVLRGRILYSKLKNKLIDLLICENNFDEAIVNYRIANIQILDLPSPQAEELFYGKVINLKRFNKLKEFEIDIYSKSDYISFHWHTYAKFVKKEKYNGNNFINIGYGTSCKNRIAQFSKEPKIIFLGFLAGYWVNLELLKKLSQIYPHIDVYGGPRIIDPNINYKGYAPSLDILADYQFGLVTISDDLLRQNSFSSKQLENFSYGLPVLTPNWRVDKLLDKGSILYDVDNFASLINEFTNKKKWEIKSNNAIKISEKLNWDKAFEELKLII